MPPSDRRGGKTAGTGDRLVTAAPVPDECCIVRPEISQKVDGAAEIAVENGATALLTRSPAYQVVRIVTENSRTLKFTAQGFEKE